MKTYVIAALIAAGAAHAQDASEMRAQWKREPSIHDVQQAALRHFALHKDALGGLRAAAAWKAAVPTFELSGGYTGAQIDDNTILDEYSATVPWVKRGATGNAIEVRGGLAWDLPRLLYNSEQTDVVQLGLVQKEVIKETTRLYFARRRIDLEIAAAKDADRKLAAELRKEEVTALLSGLTGGWFEEQLQAP